MSFKIEMFLGFFAKSTYGSKAKWEVRLVNNGMREAHTRNY